MTTTPETAFTLTVRCLKPILCGMVGGKLMSLVTSVLLAANMLQPKMNMGLLRCTTAQTAERRWMVIAMDEDDIWYDYDWCYECGGYGDDWFLNDDGELESACPYCHIYRERMGIDE